MAFMRSAFQRIHEYICDKCPRLAVKEARLIQEWILEGYDTDKDIIPAIDHCTRYGGRTIYSYGFFHDQIKKNYESRMTLVEKTKEQTKEEKDSARAKHLAWVRKRKLNIVSVGPQDFVWLDQYELKHGRIEA